MSMELEFGAFTQGHDEQVDLHEKTACLIGWIVPLYRNTMMIAHD